MDKLVLALAMMTCVAFFGSFWGKDATWLGRNDMGVALALSFLVPLSAYAAALLALMSLAGTAHARLRAKPARRWLAALGLALLPMVFLFLLDARR